MSFILDALKKSEDERLGQTGPNLAYAPTRGRREAVPRWVLVLSALLLINLLGLLALAMWRHNPQEPELAPTTRRQAQPALEQRPAIVVAQPATSSLLNARAPEHTADEGQATVRPLAQEAQETQQTQEKANTTASHEQSVTAGGSITPAGQGSSTDANQQAQPADTRVPTLNELLGEGRMMNLPSISLDLHVYAANKKDRFVFINLNKYIEGQQLKEGPTLEEITNDGVILRYQGQRFLVPRN